MVLTLRLCLLYGSHNKQRLSPYTILVDWFCITQVESVYCAVRTESLYRVEQWKFMFFEWLVLGKGGVNDVGREPTDSSDNAVSIAMVHWNVEHRVFAGEQFFSFMLKINKVILIWITCVSSAPSCIKQTRLVSKGLISAIDGGERSASRTGIYPPGESATHIRWTEDCVDPLASLDFKEMRIIFCSCLESNHGSCVV